METRLLDNADIPEWDKHVTDLIASFSGGISGGGQPMKAGICHNGRIYREVTCWGMRESLFFPEALLDMGFEDPQTAPPGYDFIFQAGSNGIQPIPEAP